MSAHDDRIARVQRLLDTLAQVRKQENDLSRMAEELHREAQQSVHLVPDTAADVTPKRTVARKRNATRNRKRKRR
jgi:hypothetical protein